MTGGAMTDKTVKQRRVVCAALLSKDGDVLLGIRHYSQDMWMQIHRRNDMSKWKNLLDENQGFVDQYFVYMSREEAYKVAKAAGQIKYPGACREGLDGWKLYSEGLY